MRAGRAVLITVAAALALACGKKDEPAAKDIGQQTADITADTQTLQDASAAVNEVVRNAADCAAAGPAIPAARTKLDEAAGRIRTATGRQTLEALRVQLKRVAELCGV